MQPIFGGNVREKRTINLGGASTSHSANADISKARLERLQREELRRQHVAATVLQAQYRGKSVRQRIVTQLRNDFDAIPLNATTIVNATRLLLACSTLVQTEDLQRISKWSRTVVVDKLLFGPFAATDGYLQQEWAHILRMTAERLLRVAVKFPSCVVSEFSELSSLTISYTDRWLQRITNPVSFGNCQDDSGSIKISARRQVIRHMDHQRPGIAKQSPTESASKTLCCYKKPSFGYCMLHHFVCH